MRAKTVFSRDGEPLGSIESVWRPAVGFPTSRGQHYVVIDPGALVDRLGDRASVHVPESAIADVTVDRIVVPLTRDEVERTGWVETPAGWHHYRAD